MIAKNKGVKGLMDFQSELSDTSVTTVLAGVHRQCCGQSVQSKLKRKLNTTPITGEGEDESRYSKRPRRGLSSSSLEASTKVPDVRDDDAPTATISGKEGGQRGGTAVDVNKDGMPLDRTCVHLIFRKAVGEPLSSINSPRRAFAAILAALHTHRALYKQVEPTDVQILHRDISCGNILATTDQTRLTGQRDDDKPLPGMLIDFDHAITMDDRVTGALHRTGTDAFVAVSVLHGAYNSYRADLESFFYVMCWVCCRFPYEKKPAEPFERTRASRTSNATTSGADSAEDSTSKPLEEWTIGNDAAKAAIKVTTVGGKTFFRDRVVKKITPTYKCAEGLLYALREAVKDSEWFTRSNLLEELENRKAEAEARQLEWLQEHPYVTAADRNKLMESPLAIYEKSVVLEEDVDGEKLFSAMVEAIQSRLDNGEIVD